MKKIKISLNTARRIALNAQLLDGRTNLPAGKEGVMQVFERLGYIQIDTLSVVKRSHHHILWTRLPDYDETMLHDLQTDDRKVFEYWGHAMSYLSMSEYRYYLPRMRHFEAPQTTWGRERLRRCGHLMEPIMKCIREEGPLSSKDIAALPGNKNGVGESDPPESIRIALDLLFWKGDIMVTERRSFRKVFDLPERVLPKDLDTRFPTEVEMGDYFVCRSLTAFGVANGKEICSFMQAETLRDADTRAVSNDVISAVLNRRKDAGEIVTLEIENNGGTDYYAFAETIEEKSPPGPVPSQVFLLSPFDNLIIRRDRTQRLFDFDYALECYVPAAKRKYGYFVLPVLWGERLVARLDSKAEKKKKTYFIRNLVFEPWFEDYDEFLPLFAAKLMEFARFNLCEKVKLEKVSPAKIKKDLNRHLLS
ncbi:MAG: winged helix-turn-helix domain-containing protein [bacterium]|nr:winged helix-turn-helix domain-containing protein [bacterium]